MDKRTLYDEIAYLETYLGNILSQIGEMKSSVHHLTEQNVNLEIENRHLRARLIELESLTAAPESKQELSKSRLNLEKIYEDGFHVCNVCYGSRRENDEECAFCLDVIYGERK